MRDVSCVFVSGGSVALRFARQGFTVALLNRSPQSAEPTLARVRELQAASAAAAVGQAHFFACDAAVEESVRAAFQQVRERLGHPSVLVYNAGGGLSRGPILELQTAAAEASLRVNALGAMWAAQEVLPAMVSARMGTILVTGATASFRGGALMASFAMGKFAQRALTQSLAREHAKNGVHVCLVRIDAAVDGPNVPAEWDREKLASPEQIANIYWQVKACSRAWAYCCGASFSRVSLHALCRLLFSVLPNFYAGARTAAAGVEQRDRHPPIPRVVDLLMEGAR